jgi:hypothetical protein
MRINAQGELAGLGAAVFGVSLILLCFAPSVSFAAGSDEVADKSARRVEALQRGVNLSHWFAQVKDRKGYVADHFQTYITVKDMELIRSLGFDHVRLSIAPEPMFVRGQADRLPANYLQYLDEAIKMILSQALAVVVDIHPDAEFKRGLQASNQHVEAFADFWRALAAHLSSTDPERVFLEVLNEPEFEDPYRWSGVQTLLVSAIRQGAPDHTIIVSGHRWASLEELLALEPLRDRNLIYNFHFYSPALFTHQGATWGVNLWHYLKDVPYPSATATPQYPQTRDGWAYQINPASDRIDFRVGNAQWMREISAGFLWFDLAQACQDHRAGSAAQLAKAKPYMFESAQQKPAIGLSECRQASVTVNEGGMWGYLKPDGSRAVGTTTERTCEQELASDVIRRIMPIAQRNCIAVSITWK